jgi:aryl-alcohol dehydrogenase-like predicted oxidoreductase
MAMLTRTLGGLQVSAIGLGCLPLGNAYGNCDEEQAAATLTRAMDLGVTLLDMADVYGPYTVERIVGRVVGSRRDEVVIGTKFGNECRDDGSWIGLNSRPEHVRHACDASLQRLGIDTIDLYTQHRVDPSVPIEETWGAVAELVAAGKVRYAGMSEAAPATVRRAHAVHPVTTLQNEYSLFSREPEGEVLDTVRELGIALVCYCPLGRGLLTGAVTAGQQFASGDNRRGSPRFSTEHLDANVALAERVAEVASAKGISPAQLALAWLLSRGPDVIPIPGAERPEQVEENVAAASVSLTAAELARLDELMPPGVASGPRFAPEQLATIGR